MPVDPTIEDLILREVDGRAFPEESARLREIASGDRAVGKELEGQREIASILAHVPRLDAPPGLTRKVMDALPAASTPSGGSFFPRGGRGGGRTIHFLYAAAAGLFVGTIMGPWLMARLSPQTPADQGVMVGGMTPREPGRAVEGSARVDLPGAPAMARLIRDGNGWVVEVQRNAEDGLSVTVLFDPDAFTVSAFRPEGHAGRLQVGDGEASWRQEGSQRTALELSRIGPGESAIRLRFSAAGSESPGEGALLVP